MVIVANVNGPVNNSASTNHRAILKNKSDQVANEISLPCGSFKQTGLIGVPFIGSIRPHSPNSEHRHRQHGRVRPRPLSGDGRVSGEWAEGCNSEVSGRGYARYYTFTLWAGSYVTITLESSDVDTYLYLREGEARSGDFLYDDDGGGITKSQIQETLVAGTYTIEATTYGTKETGSFTLTVAGLGTTASPLETLFDEIISETERREAFSEVKETSVSFSALEDMRQLRSEFVASKTETGLYHALVKLSNARRDRHLRVSPVAGGLQPPEQRPCVSAPIHVLPDLSDMHNLTFLCCRSR